MNVDKSTKKTDKIPNEVPPPVPVKRKMKVISVWNNKGGTGKTTLSFHLAQGLALSGNYVMLVDNDPQLTLTQQCCNMKSDLPGMYQVYQGKASLKDCVYIDDAINVNEERTLAIVPGHRQFKEAYDPKKSATFNFAKLLEGLQDEDIQNSVDYVIIDNNPAFEGPTRAALEASDEIFLCSIPTKFDWHGLQRSFALIKEMGPETLAKVTHIIPTVVRKTTLQKNYLHVMRTVYGDKVTENVCVDTASVPEALEEKKIVYLYKFTSNYAQQMISLISELFPEVTSESSKETINLIRQQKKMEPLMEHIRKRKEEQKRLQDMADSFTGSAESTQPAEAEEGVSNG